MEFQSSSKVGQESMYKQLLEKADKGSAVQFPGFEKRFLIIDMQIRDGKVQH